MSIRNYSLVLILLVESFLSTKVFGQNRLHKLKKWLDSADTVLIASHYSPSNESGLDEDTGETWPATPLFIGGRLNPKIVVEHQVLSKMQVQHLGKVLTKPTTPITKRTLCFNPHHIILAVHSGKTSYLEICFECRRFEAFMGIQLKPQDIANEKYDELASFFKDAGFTFQL